MFIVNKTDTHIFIFYLKDKRIIRESLMYYESETKQYEYNGFNSPYRKYYIVTKSITK